MKIKISVSTNKVGSKTTEVVEMDDDWAEMSEKERETFAFDCMLDLIDWTWEEVQ